jgi:Flp pilus assembly pilin Flp
MHKLIAAVKEFGRQQAGAAVIEYALLGLFVGAAAVAALTLLGQRVASVFSNLSAGL